MCPILKSLVKSAWKDTPLVLFQSSGTLVSLTSTRCLSDLLLRLPLPELRQQGLNPYITVQLTNIFASLICSTNIISIAVTESLL